ncbi:MAG: hypothetical protein J6B28_07120 [Eubacterium sp.]|nr:hypothetical protein [Eubacterium sp.]
MEFNHFTNTLCAQLLPLFSEGTQINIQSIEKNNGVHMDALIIHEPNINISPTIYLEDYYQLYSDGMSIDELCHIIYDVFLEARLNHSINPEIFTDYEQAKNNLTFQLLNYEKNKSRLSHIPHIRYLDLAIVFSCVFRMENAETASILIRTEHLELWNKSFDDVKKQAFDNTPRLLPAYIQPIMDVIQDLLNKNHSLSAEFMLPLEEGAPSLYVLTNETQTYGASCMLYPNLLAEFADELASDLYILPSSIHEVLLLPTTARDSDDELRHVVQTVNDNQLPLTQQLSDCVYYYSRASHTLSL